LLPLAAWLRLRGNTVIYDAHESVRADVGSKPYLSPPVARALGGAAGLIERVVGRRLAHLVAATDTIASQFQFPTTVVANYPLLDEWTGADTTLDSFRGRPLQGAYVGVITEDRCRHEMLAAAKLAQERRPAFRLLLAGPVEVGDPPPEGPGCIYRGTLTRPAVASVLGECRFGVVLLKPLPNNVTGLPTKFFEYLASGLPVIVSESLRALVTITHAERCGLVVDESDVAGFAEAMLYLVDNPDEAHEMGQRGRQAVLQRYTWSTEGEKLLRLYDRLLGAGSGLGRGSEESATGPCPTR
jgi:glycosyltransferase involved in cell wall biosynthesis